MDAVPGRLTAVRIVGIFGLVMMAGQFQRSALAVIAPELARDPGLSPEQLGFVGSAYFLAVLSVSLPNGILIDRVGPRIVITAQMAFTALGAMLMAWSDTFAGLVAGRALMGVGTAGTVVCASVVFSRWFAPERFTLMTSTQNALGFFGYVIATAPFAAATALYGWREPQVMAAGVTALAGLLAFLLIRDAPPGHASQTRAREPLRRSVAGLFASLRIAGILKVHVMNLVGFSVLGTIASLWSGVYLRDVHGLAEIERGHVLLMMALGAIAGNLGYGFVDRRINDPKFLSLIGMIVTACLLLILAAVPGIPIAVAVVVLVAFTVAASYPVLMWGHARALLPPQILGRGLATFTMSGVLGYSVVQMASGFIIGAFPADGGTIPESAFRTTFVFLAVLVVAAATVYARAPKSAAYGQG